MAEGYSQTSGVDFHVTISSVAKLNSVRVLISLTINVGWELFQLDVKNVFLHGDLQEKVFMQQPPSFVGEEWDHVCIHKKVNLWFKAISEGLVW